MKKSNQERDQLKNELESARSNITQFGVLTLFSFNVKFKFADPFSKQEQELDRLNEKLTNRQNQLNCVEKKVLKIKNEKRTLVNEKCSLEKTMKQQRDGQSSTLCQPGIESEIQRDSSDSEEENEPKNEEPVNYVKGKICVKVRKKKWNDSSFNTLWKTDR